MLKIEILRRDHDRSGFDCGDSALNQYIRKIARQHLNKGISRTFVIVDTDNLKEILGFYTLIACEVFVAKLPRKYAKKYPSKLPAAKLARLAVAQYRQRQGLGTHMMINAMERILKVTQHLGIIGFFVDAKDKNARIFYEQFGFIPLSDNPLELFLPLATLRNAYERKET